VEEEVVVVIQEQEVDQVEDREVLELIFHQVVQEFL
jgi:hypothetical protein